MSNQTPNELKLTGWKKLSVGAYAKSNIGPTNRHVRISYPQKLVGKDFNMHEWERENLISVHKNSHNRGFSNPKGGRTWKSSKLRIFESPKFSKIWHVKFQTPERKPAKNPKKFVTKRDVLRNYLYFLLRKRKKITKPQRDCTHEK